MTIDAISCQGLGGGMELGFVQAGFDLKMKLEQEGDFGLAQCADNRLLLGDFDYVGGSGNWPARQVPVVFGNPPCSGFSLMSNHRARGIDAKINSCMWDLVRYGAACNAEFVVMESVQAAGKQGNALMTALRDEISSLTGRQYYLFNVFHNSIHLGGSSQRRRYFAVFTVHEDFNVRTPIAHAMPTVMGVIGDLEYTDFAQDGVRYSQPPGWWNVHKRNPDGYVYGNVTYNQVYGDDTGWIDVKHALEFPWPGGKGLNDVLRKAHEDGQEVMPRLLNKFLTRREQKASDWDKVQAGELTENDYKTNWSTPYPKLRPPCWSGGAWSTKRWRADGPCFVIGGNAMTSFVHPTLDRLFTYREAARIMGFPDAWRVDSYIANKNDKQVFGKGVCVEAGEWIGDQVYGYLDQGPVRDSAAEPMERVDEFEYTINVTNKYPDVYKATFPRPARIEV